jgi:hypothetical protein
MNNATTTKGTFVHPSLPKMGTMTGYARKDVFIPDVKFHTPLYKFYGVEALEGLYLDQGTFTPAQ